MSSTHRKSASNKKASRPNLHSAKNSGFDQQHKGSIGEGICEVSDDEKMKSLSKVLDEAEAEEANDNEFVKYSLMQMDDRAHFLPLLPFDSDTQIIHNVISTHTMADFLRSGGVVSGVQTSFIIVDCRFPFEFQGGHIKGALNICSPEDLRPKFFYDASIINAHLTSRTILIFHCEHS